MGRTVLVCVDGSAPAHAACRRACEVVREGDTFYIVTVVPDIRVPTTPLVPETMIFADNNSAQAELEAYAQEVVDTFAKECRESGCAGTIETKVLRGDARHVLVAAVEEVSANLVVVGNTGKGKIQRMLLGSVSSYLVHHVHCDVWIVKEH